MEKFCYICHLPDGYKNEHGKKYTFVSVCQCTSAENGSMRIHDHCYDVLKKNSIKCQICQTSFPIKNIHFILRNILKSIFTLIIVAMVCSWHIIAYMYPICMRNTCDSPCVDYQTLCLPYAWLSIQANIFLWLYLLKCAYSAWKTPTTENTRATPFQFIIIVLFYFQFINNIILEIMHHHNSIFSWIQISLMTSFVFIHFPIFIYNCFPHRARSVFDYDLHM